MCPGSAPIDQHKPLSKLSDSSYNRYVMILLTLMLHAAKALIDVLLIKFGYVHVRSRLACPR